MALNGFGLLLLRSSYSESEIMFFIENVKTLLQPYQNINKLNRALKIIALCNNDNTKALQKKPI